MKLGDVNKNAKAPKLSSQERRRRLALRYERDELQRELERTEMLDEQERILHQTLYLVGIVSSLSGSTPTMEQT